MSFLFIIIFYLLIIIYFPLVFYFFLFIYFFFRYFRILQTGPNSSGNFGLYIGGLELYGTLIQYNEINNNNNNVNITPNSNSKSNYIG